MAIIKYDAPLYPNNSKLISSDVIGQFVTPQNTAVIPTAAHNEGDMPRMCPARQPKVAPMKKLGTISPPLNPDSSVTAVNSILIRNATGTTFPAIALSITGIPAPR